MILTTSKCVSKLLRSTCSLPAAGEARSGLALPQNVHDFLYDGLKHALQAKMSFAALSPPRYHIFPIRGVVFRSKVEKNGTFTICPTAHTLVCQQKERTLARIPASLGTPSSEFVALGHWLSFKQTPNMHVCGNEKNALTHALAEAFDSLNSCPTATEDRARPRSASPCDARGSRVLSAHGNTACGTTSPPQL